MLNKIYTRSEIADEILKRMNDDVIFSAKDAFFKMAGNQFFCVDNLLPEEMARAIYKSFPEASQMVERNTIRERKHVAAQMNLYDPQAEEALFSFHDPRVVSVIGRVTGMSGLVPDEHLYAGGISLMTQGNFLNPHLDNSHNNDQSLYRVLNLLYYVSPDWKIANGGNLELWPNGFDAPPELIESLYNRLVVMTTGPGSWHSVNKVKSDQPRCCVSNYYFSEIPVGLKPYFRVTTFRGRPENPLNDLILRVDGVMRQLIRKIVPAGLVKTKHLYKKFEKNE